MFVDADIGSGFGIGVSGEMCGWGVNRGWG